MEIKINQECTACKTQVRKTVGVDTCLCDECVSERKLKINAGIILLAGIGLAGIGASSFDDAVKIILGISMMLSAGLVYQNTQG